MKRPARLVLVALLALGLGLLGRWRTPDPTGRPSSRPSSSSGPAVEVPFRAGTVECSRVHDGDTLSVVVEGETVRIRVFGIDAPEKGQPFSDRSRQRARELAQGRRVLLRPVEADAYGRLVARVEIDDEDLGGRLIEEGLAWHYRRYSDDPEYAAREAAAREARRGLWRERSPTPPWVFRREATGGGSAARSSTP